MPAPLSGGREAWEGVCRRLSSKGIFELLSGVTAVVAPSRAELAPLGFDVVQLCLEPGRGEESEDRVGENCFFLPPPVAFLGVVVLVVVVVVVEGAVAALMECSSASERVGRAGRAVELR